MVVVVFTRASSCRSDGHGRGRWSSRDRRRGRRMADRVADNAMQIAAVVVVRVGRAHLVGMADGSAVLGETGGVLVDVLVRDVGPAVGCGGPGSSGKQ